MDASRSSCRAARWISACPSCRAATARTRCCACWTARRSDERLSLDGLGFPAGPPRASALAQLPYGLTLITGPTGSGKSTTLYGALSELNTGDEKIITIEDPVEYEMAGVLQIPVNEKKG